MAVVLLSHIRVEGAFGEKRRADFFVLFVLLISLS
jgi:hypothetical protein